MTVRNVKKNLAGQQDLLPGVGPYNQIRRGVAVSMDGPAKSYIELWKSYCGDAYVGTFEDGFTATTGSVAVSLTLGKAYRYIGAAQVTVAKDSSPDISWSELVVSTDSPMVRESLRRSYAEAGYNVVGTFLEGFTIVNANDVGIDNATGKGYTGPAGPVAAGTDPASGGFVDRSGELLRTSVLKVTRSYPLDVTDYLPDGYVTDGTVDYIHIIKQVFDLAAGVRPVLMPNFPVLVDPARVGFSFPGILVPSNSNIIFQQNSKLLTKPNSLTNYEILSIRDSSNVTVYRPFVVGDKYTHTGTTGEFGMGISIRGACKNITIIEPETNELWGDGIYIGQIVDTIESTPENVTIIKPIGRKNRRQGLSITSVNGLTVKDPQWWDTKSRDCPTPLPYGPHAGVDIEPNSVNSLLRGISFTNVRGGGNDGGLFYWFLGGVVTTSGDRYHVEIDVDSVTDEGSRHAIANMGLDENSFYSGAVNIGRVVSNNSIWNPIRHRNNPVQCGLVVNIDYASLNNWQSLTTIAARYRTPVVIEYEGSVSGYPTLGNLHIGKLDLFTTVPAAALSDNAVFVGTSTGTLATPATSNVDITFGSVRSTKPLRIEGVIGAEIGLNNRFGSQIKYAFAGSTNYLPHIFADFSIEPAGGSPTITLPSVFPSDLDGNAVRFKYTQGGTATLARLRSLTVPMYMNGVIATNVTFDSTAGVVTLTFRSGIYYVTAEGVITKET